jgi:DNA-binding MarR family transcriptional regulator
MHPTTVVSFATTVAGPFTSVSPGRDDLTMPERPISRRGQPFPYIVEFIPASRLWPDVRREAPEAAAQLVAAGRVSSSLRRLLRSNGIDPRMARLVLCFYGRLKVRVRDIAFIATVSPPTASRWLDQAETLGLVDKFYNDGLDLRATSARLTARGRELRATVEHLLAAAAPYAPTHFGKAFGARRAPPLDPDD